VSDRKSLLEDIARPTTLCAYCPKMCRFACPVAEAEARETVTPWAKMSLLYLARGGKFSLDDPQAQRALEACTGCAACVESCAHGNPVFETLALGRRAAGTPRGEEIARNCRETGDARRRTFDDVYDAFPRATSGAVGYFPGCARGAEGTDAVARDLRALERALGAPVPLIDLPAGKRCCGYPARAEGYAELADEASGGLRAAAARFKTVVTPDPGCVDTAGGNIVPLVELLAEHKERFSGASAGARVRYHDPCYLGRRRGTYEPPRELLRAATGRAPLEFNACKIAGDCAGGGGLYPLSNPEGAGEAARRRLEDVLGEHDVVATACPSARRSLAKAGAKAVDVVDVILGEL
jgi:Fe-S oxidoreductase